jgi:hypothetical protein
MSNQTHAYRSSAQVPQTPYRTLQVNHANHYSGEQSHAVVNHTIIEEDTYHPVEESAMDIIMTENNHGLPSPPDNEIDELEYARAIPLPPSRTPSAASKVFSADNVMNDVTTSGQLSRRETDARREHRTGNIQGANSGSSQLPGTNGSFPPFVLEEGSIKRKFGPLIQVLLQFGAEGIHRPPRGVVAEKLLRQSPNLYARCNVTNWADYSRTAEAAEIISLIPDPGSQGRVELRPTYKTLYWKTKFGLTQESPSSSKVPQLPPAFAPLLQYLATCLKEGRSKVPRSSANDHLLVNHRGLYKKHGYETWRAYAAAAEESEHVKLTCGTGGGDAFIALGSKWRGRL